MYLLLMTVPPQYSEAARTRHCHGQEKGLASVPPTMRVSEISGWIACLPHCGNGVGGLAVVGPVTPDVTGSVVTGTGCGNVTAPYQQRLTQSCHRRCNK